MEHLAAGDFDDDELRRPGRYAVAFTAGWCPFCRSFEPTFEMFDGDPRFRAAIVDLSDLDNPLWERFQISIVPSVLVFVDGRVAYRADGEPGEGLDTGSARRARLAAEGSSPLDGPL